MRKKSEDHSKIPLSISLRFRNFVKLVRASKEFKGDKRSSYSHRIIVWKQKADNTACNKRSRAKFETGSEVVVRLTASTNVDNSPLPLSLSLSFRHRSTLCKLCVHLIILISLGISLLISLKIWRINCLGIDPSIKIKDSGERQPEPWKRLIKIFHSRNVETFE